MKFGDSNASIGARHSSMLVALSCAWLGGHYDTIKPEGQADKRALLTL